MTTVIIPTRHRPDMLIRCLTSLAAADTAPDVVAVVVDDDPESVIVGASFPWANFIVNLKNIGFWQSINRVFEMAEMPENEPFCYFGKDVTFDQYWLKNAELCFSRRFKNGLGLITFKDDIQNGANASHGMSTRAWLRVVYGEPFFPRGYFQYFCDSEFTNRSRELGRYAYCKTSYVPHHHEPTGRTDVNHDDEGLKNRRDIEWTEGGKAKAKARLEIAMQPVEELL